MPKEKKSCPHCGASMVEYKHGLSKALAEGLVRLHREGKPVNISVLQLTRNQWDNFQKLRYWDLVARYSKKANANIRKGGVWTITQKGIDFVRGEITVPRAAVTYRGERVRYEGEQIWIWQVDEKYRYRADYAEAARPRFPGGLVESPGQELIWPEVRRG